ncbi:putative 2-dehydropantoate 2-reductase [Nostoc parmelioides]|uniref:2-dehydropantoate 2-reductase n=1 Tax=Nostoc parmelioides FACHB-3921 TaxID=2692909 RepID=A0ABR8BQL0_9NOSO|nr:putative 2-dehydropantoate 2-reductase [Nostoc parmelioides]MBD2255101.1 putative 2-dehydropantoate 2-reductase [Nostoc parmelioides FACHB-3921]
MSERKYAIVGTGALGGYYGAKLQKAGSEVHFLLKSDYEKVSQDGLLVESKDGDFILPQVNAYNDVAKMPKCDVVVVALKTTQNHLLPNLLPPIVKDNGIVLVLQNGLGVEEEIAEILPKVHIIGGLCFLCSNKLGAGHIHHLDYGQITLGEYAHGYSNMGITDGMRQIAHDFRTAGISIELVEDLLLGRWKKLVWNIPYNGLSVVLNARTDELMADTNTRTLVEQLMYEVKAGAKSMGRNLPDSFIQTMLDYTVKMKPYRTSMKIDYDECRPLEVEAIVGNPLRKAQEVGVNLPQINCLYHQLKFLDGRNRIGQLLVGACL